MNEFQVSIAPAKYSNEMNECGFRRSLMTHWIRSVMRDCQANSAQGLRKPHTACFVLKIACVRSWASLVRRITVAVMRHVLWTWWRTRAVIQITMFSLRCQENLMRCATSLRAAKLDLFGSYHSLSIFPFADSQPKGSRMGGATLCKVLTSWKLALGLLWTILFWWLQTSWYCQRPHNSPERMNWLLLWAMQLQRYSVGSSLGRWAFMASLQSYLMYKYLRHSNSGRSYSYLLWSVKLEY